MKFYSKANLYSVILRHSIPAEPLTGRALQPGLSVRFEDGLAIVDDEKTCKMLLEHKDFNEKFFMFEETAGDPFARQRATEPDHSMQEINYGHVGKSTGMKPKVKVSEAMTKHINESIKKGIKEGITVLLPKIVEELKNSAIEASAEKEKKAKEPESKKASNTKESNS